METHSGLKTNIAKNKDVVGNTAFVEELRQALPQFFTSTGCFDKEKFDNALSENMGDELEVGYRLDFIGKDLARRQAGDAATTVLVPDVEHNKKPENKNSKNLFFTGDNLEVLRHLKNNYYNSVDMIYIDPPYNTGSDGFVYADKFEYSDDQLKKTFRMDDKQIKRLKTIQGRSSHSAWLTFMYPRLYLARQLLKDTGVIFISIDDNEQANLRLLMDELWGGGNFVGDIAWRRFNSQSNIGSFAKVKDSILFYAKNEQDVNLGRLPLSDTAKKEYQYKDSRGIYARRPCIDSVRGRYVFDFETPNGTVLHDHWMMSEEDFLKENEEGLIHWPENGGNPMRKMYLKDALKNGQISNDFWGVEYGNNRNATEEIKKLFDDARIFDFPKPTKLLSYLINLSGCSDDALILDFFAGSGTTADAVMQLNAEDGGNRHFIMVQLDEPCDEKSVAKKNGYETIDQISRDRIIRASKKIQEENEKLENFDGGFKHFRVRPLPQNYYSRIEDFGTAPLEFATVGDIEGGSLSLLYTWLAMDGFKFEEEVKEVEYAGCKAWTIQSDCLYILEKWNVDATIELINKLGKKEMSLRKVVVAEGVLSFERSRELGNELAKLSEKDLNIKFEIRD